MIFLICEKQDKQNVHLTIIFALQKNMFMRKLILLLGFTIPSIISMAQEKDAGKQSIFFRLGAGYGQRLNPVQGELDAEGQKHYSRLRRGGNLSLQIGYFISEKDAFALVYTRLGSKAENTITGNKRKSLVNTSFAGLTYQRFIPVGDKKDVNFNLKLGPGFLFYREESTLINGTTGVSSQQDYSKRNPGLITGIGFDFKLSKNVRFELNADKTWGRIKENSKNINLGVFSLGAGLRFQF